MVGYCPICNNLVLTKIIKLVAWPMVVCVRCDKEEENEK